MLKPAYALFLLISALIFSPFTHANDAWEIYKARFLMPDGRIIDTGNNNVSHTEGQGFSMLMAVANNDRKTFDQLWNWTNKNLRNPVSGLFYWRYNPASAQPISDKNNATDGDVIIAWALLQAEARWKVSKYGRLSDEITQALMAKSIIDYAGYKVMLPGNEGFYHNSEVVLNPSYFVFPAWNAFAQRSHLQIWQTLITDGQTLLSKMGQDKVNLPADWVSLRADGSLTPAKNWPPRMSYDAIRVPLYLHWYDPTSSLLLPWRVWFSQYPRTATPAWVNVTTGDVAEYMMDGGLLAIRDLTMDASLNAPQITSKDDYYSASLKMLAWLAYNQTK